MRGALPRRALNSRSLIAEGCAEPAALPHSAVRNGKARKSPRNTASPPAPHAVCEACCRRPLEGCVCYPPLSVPPRTRSAGTDIWAKGDQDLGAAPGRPGNSGLGPPGSALRTHRPATALTIRIQTPLDAPSMTGSRGIKPQDRNKVKDGFQGSLSPLGEESCPPSWPGLTRQSSIPREAVSGCPAQGRA